MVLKGFIHFEVLNPSEPAATSRPTSKHRFATREEVPTMPVAAQVRNTLDLDEDLEG